MTSDRPIDIFELMVTNYFIGLAVKNTNLYTTQFMTGCEFARSSGKFEPWKSVRDTDILCSVDLT